MSDLITLDEVAEILGVPLNTVRYWRHTNSTGIRFERVGRRVKARRSDVEAWVEAKFK